MDSGRLPRASRRRDRAHRSRVAVRQGEHAVSRQAVRRRRRHVRPNRPRLRRFPLRRAVAVQRRAGAGGRSATCRPPSTAIAAYHRRRARRRQRRPRRLVPPRPRAGRRQALRRRRADLERDPGPQRTRLRRSDGSHGPPRLRPLLAEGAAAGRAAPFASSSPITRRTKAEERLDTDFFVGMAPITWARSPTSSIALLPVRLPEKQMSRDLESKARLLLVAQARYVDAVRVTTPSGRPPPASRSARSIASSTTIWWAHRSRRRCRRGQQVYLEEVKKQVRNLLSEGHQRARKEHHDGRARRDKNDWVRRSNEQMDQLRKLLVPGPLPPADAAPTPSATPAAPFAAPARRGPALQ